MGISGHVRHFLRRLENEGPVLVEITPESPQWLQRLYDKGLIEPHPPSRYRITDAGREALEER